MSYKTIAIKKDTFNLINDCEFIFRKENPQMNKIPMSKEKIIYEVIKFYLKGTKKEVYEFD